MFSVHRSHRSLGEQDIPLSSASRGGYQDDRSLEDMDVGSDEGTSSTGITQRLGSEGEGDKATA